MLNLAFFLSVWLLLFIIDLFVPTLHRLTSEETYLAVGFALQRAVVLIRHASTYELKKKKKKSRQYYCDKILWQFIAPQL